MLTSSLWRTPEYVLRPNDAAGHEPFPITTQDTLLKYQPPQIAAANTFAPENRKAGRQKIASSDRTKGDAVREAG